MSSEQKNAVKKKNEAHKKLIANTTKHVVDNKVATVTFAVFQEKISGIGEEQIINFLEKT